jgi:cytosine/creatinine deaminase
VAVSHAFALGMVDARELATTAEALAAGGVAIMTNGPGADAMPPLRALVEAGVTVFGGSDNVRDAWSPFGDADLLRRAGLIAYRADFRADDDLRLAFRLVTDNARAVMGLEPVATRAGAPADLIAVPAGDIPEAIADPRFERLVIRAGRVLRGA